MPDYCRPGNVPLKINSCFMRYIGAIVLGMDDALVEMTGALAGFTMALSDNRLIILAGLTTGVAATLSMAASEFLSCEAASGKKPLLTAIACGATYLGTVALLLLPYFLCKNPLASLALCLLLAALIIFCFTWTIAQIRHTCFRRDFMRMLGISFSVAAIAFAISWLAKTWWGIEA